MPSIPGGWVPTIPICCETSSATTRRVVGKPKRGGSLGSGPKPEIGHSTVQAQHAGLVREERGFTSPHSWIGSRGPGMALQGQNSGSHDDRVQGEVSDTWPPGGAQWMGPLTRYSLKWTHQRVRTASRRLRALIPVNKSCCHVQVLPESVSTHGTVNYGLGRVPQVKDTAALWQQGSGLIAQPLPKGPLALH